MARQNVTRVELEKNPSQIFSHFTGAKAPGTSSDPMKAGLFPRPPGEIRYQSLVRSVTKSRTAQSWVQHNKLTGRESKIYIASGGITNVKPYVQASVKVIGRTCLQIGARQFQVFGVQLEVLGVASL